MQDFQPTSAYHAANFQLPAPLIDALQPAAFVEALNQSGDSHRDAVAIRGHRLCSTVRGIDIQVDVFTSYPADRRSLGKPLSRPTLARGLARAPAPGSWIGRRGTIARGDVRPPGGNCGA